jgi:putative oxidoreductase
MQFLRAYLGSTDKRGVIAMNNNFTAPQANLTNHATALLRVTSGGLLLAHGLIKVLVFTPAGTAGFFESIGFPGVLAYPVMAGEIVLGAALVLGLMTRLAALLALPILLGAIIPHAGNGFTFSNPGGGWEFPVFWTVALAVQAMLGGGSFAIGNPFARSA